MQQQKMIEQEGRPLHANPLMDRLSYLASDIESEVGLDAAEEFRAWLDRWGDRDPSEQDDEASRAQGAPLGKPVPDGCKPEAEFSLEVVEETLRDAIEDSDQVSALWAAYLFGFDRSRVVQAWGMEEVVLVEFVSAEYRERALEEYRRLTE